MKKLLCIFISVMFLCAVLSLVACAENDKHTHVFSEKIVPATCLEDGYTEHFCSCGESYRDNIQKATGHHYEKTTVAATCTDKGYTLYLCSCGDSFKENETEPLGHSFTNYVSDHNGTCVKEGTKTAKCDRCDATDVQTDPTAERKHQYVATVTPPTCTEDGFTDNVCAYCGDSFLSDIVPKTGHFPDDEWYSDGSGHWKLCTVCLIEVDREFHTATTWSSSDTKHYQTCTVCQTVFNNGSHAFDDGVVIKEPSCTEEGERKFTCMICQKTRIEPIEMSEHAIGANWLYDENEHWKECVDCHKKEVVSTHVYGEGVVTRDPTCTKEGEMTYTCEVCSATRTEPVEKTPHDIGETWFFDDGGHWQECVDCHTHANFAEHDYDTGVVTVESTCTTEGEITFTCEVCQKTRADSLPLADHTYSDEWSYTDTFHYHAATCGCDVIADVAPHVYNEGYVAKKPTATSPGIRTYSCIYCGRSYSEEIPPTTCTVIWKNGNVILKTMTVDYGTIFPEYTGATPTRASAYESGKKVDYVFYGWSTQDDVPRDSEPARPLAYPTYSVTGNITLYARYWKKTAK